MKIWY